MKYYIQWEEWLRSGNSLFANSKYPVGVMCVGTTPIRAASDDQAKDLFETTFPKAKVLKVSS